jgi:RNA polymerase sigma-70 factor (ECF subfamily)
VVVVVLLEIDRELLELCLQRKPRAWENFVDRFMGLLVHVVNHTAQARSIRLTPHNRDDLIAEVFLELLRNDFAILRNFRGQSSLATYLTVVARRIVVNRLLDKHWPTRLGEVAAAFHNVPDSQTSFEHHFDNQDEVEQLLRVLHGAEAQVVRMYHLEGKSFREISTALGMPENSIGPILSRARNKLRQGRAGQGRGE